MPSIRAASTVGLVAAFGAPLSLVFFGSRARSNQPVSATHGGVVGSGRWG
jgi:hypothetical protein